MVGNETRTVPEAPENLGLLLSMELPLIISLGAVWLPFGDILGLHTGSVVELNRTADEAVDVIVNDRVVARGEVVAVDGNYGIRITEVASQAARLESSGSPRTTPAASMPAADRTPRLEKLPIPAEIVP